ncbi:MAG: DUF4383 domain-containing protein [Nocardiopsaceae bacterium]|nr:DUF4383 domain-containing protein [Nocardiopsaceae bacterium]
MGKPTTGSKAPVSPDATRGPARMVAGIVGLIFLIVGVLGFIPGVTTNYDQMQWLGHDSGAHLLGIFQVSILHNIVHLLFGVAGLAAATTATLARWYLFGSGVIYLALWLYGLIINQESAANFVPLNNADNWLHLGLGLGLIILGLLVRRGSGVRS